MTAAARKIALIGAPIDEGAGAEGALMGPAALRVAGLARLLRDLGLDVEDRGDIAEPAPEPSGLGAADAARCRHADRIAAWTRAIHDATYAALRDDRLPIALGGDHSLSMGTVPAVARRCAEQGRPLHVLWLDAHADFNTPQSTPSGNMHGMSVAYFTGEPSLRGLGGGRPFVPVAPRDVHVFGLRSIDPEEKLRAVAAGLRTSDMRRIDEFGVSALMRDYIDALPDEAHLHVSLDIDFLDPAIAPGVGTTVPGGATYREAHLIMEMLHDSELVGSFEIVELNPFMDERGRSAHLLAELAASLFGRTVVDRPRGRRRD